MTHSGIGEEAIGEAKLTPVAARFFEKVVADWQSGCWNWVKAKDKDGYGVVKDGPRTARAHRWIYERLISSIPDEFELDHLCVNRGCVAPYHLEPVTKAENYQRMKLRTTEAEAQRPTKMRVGATTVRELMCAQLLSLPIGGVIVLPGRKGAKAVRSVSPAPYEALPFPKRLVGRVPFAIEEVFVQ